MEVDQAFANCSWNNSGGSNVNRSLFTLLIPTRPFRPWHPEVIMIVLKRLMCIIVLLLFSGVVLGPEPSSADVDKRWDWPGKKRDLKVCLTSSAGCPANMADSLKAAINIWNADLTSWSLTFTTNCDSADIKVSCGTMSGLGEWSADYDSGKKEATNHKIKINSGSSWGYCNNKYEVVSTLVHELGHAMRMKHTGSGDQMRAEQDTLGHSRTPTKKDSTEAALTDGSANASSTTTPSGIKKNQLYSGSITPGPGDPPFDLLSATGVFLNAYRPAMVQILGFVIAGNDQLDWDATIDPLADGTEPYVLTIQYPTSTVERWGFLHVVDPGWDELWQPIAVAPPDTAVPGPLSDVLLYAWNSQHPAGLDAMDFTWFIDNNRIVKGEFETSVHLSIGSHQVVLHAEDDFGNESTDTMTVTVGSEIPSLGTIGIVILLTLLMLTAAVFLRRNRLPVVSR